MSVQVKIFLLKKLMEEMVKATEPGPLKAIALPHELAREALNIISELV